MLVSLIIPKIIIQLNASDKILTARDKETNAELVKKNFFLRVN